MQSFLIKSPANIAFIKYWGQADPRLILPCNDSFSMNLSHCFTTLEVTPQQDPTIKTLEIKEYKSNLFIPSDQSALQKVLTYYQTAKEFLGVKNDRGFSIKSANSFPKKAGIASSASFFSALALAFATLFEKTLLEKNLSILARLSGSGSACRSVPDGFSWWQAKPPSFATSIAPPNYWKLVDNVLILSFAEKAVGSQDGHKHAQTSPLFLYRQLDVKNRSHAMKTAFEKKDFTQFGTLLEQEAISMHAVMMTQTPPLYFWSARTIEVLKKVLQLRSQGIEAYYTIDAGENIHLICESQNKEKVIDYFKNQPEVEEIISNFPAIGTRKIVI